MLIYSIYIEVKKHSKTFLVFKYYKKALKGKTRDLCLARERTDLGILNILRIMYEDTESGAVFIATFE